MLLLALGINHKTAPVSVRERLAFTPERIPQALHELREQAGAREAAILSTCNRTELYCGLEQPDSRPIIHWLGQFHQLAPADLAPYLYQHPGPGAVRHMLRVAAGLDSMVLGEPQILGQVKSAYQEARAAGTLGTLLERLFQHTFAVAKQVRTDTAIGASPVSVAFAAVSLSKQIFADLSRLTALLIGAGETIELVARHLHEQGVGRLVVANRTLERAHNLAIQFGGYAIGLEEIAKHLAEADMVISSTASPGYLLEPGLVRSSLRRRKHRPMFMVDIAVPRDIDPAVGELDDVYLYTVDDLQEIIQENLQSRREAARQAEEIIDVQVDHFMAWLRSQDAGRPIRALRRQAEALRDEVQAKALAQLRQGKDPEQVLRFLANTLTNKLIHAPSAGLREAAAQGRSDLLLAISELYQLQPTDDDGDPAQ
ncbi:MAG TPA: glutamyl-tRNA reductase [Candidatus Competibacteraceae bacterium]|nr:glutamyl-tRNA reductase [Candidatus Competibacteraceae bacterium]